MENTDKAYCREIADLLAAHGVKHCVVCPGSRNAPLIVALHRHPALRCISVIDERSAAFSALGIASISRSPVAIVCTSGSAVLNFAPAVAEAYYRQVPLIVISADRPEEWIDQDDSQTIRQPGILANIVKKSVDVQVELDESASRSEAQAWHINRVVNDSLIDAMSAPKGPVHINVQLDAPLGRIRHDCPVSGFARKIDVVKPSGLLSTAHVRALASLLAFPRKVLVIAGFMQPDDKLSRALSLMATLPNVAIMSEAQANIHPNRSIISMIDLTLSCIPESLKKELAPDIVITFGGSLVSRLVKSWLRNLDIKHWHVGMQPWSVDCFTHLEKRIVMEPRNVLPALGAAMQRQSHGHHNEDSWSDLWAKAKLEAWERSSAMMPKNVWCDLSAMGLLMTNIPNTWNLQLSNGTAVRYAQMFDHNRIHRIDCNRGVSGIDGSVSTAIGAAFAYSGKTLLITGDMSLQYDISALSSPLLTPRMKIAVLNNGGGGIFRCVPSTRDLKELDQFFACRTNLPLRELAQAYGFAYFESNDFNSLHACWRPFVNESERPALLNLVTDSEVSAAALRKIIPL